eukprot:COSAG06_NODE_6186_length_3060_cov_2.881121_3_plen_273_part_00
MPIAKGMSPAAKQAIHTKRKRKAIDALEAMYGAPSEPPPPPSPAAASEQDAGGGTAAASAAARSPWASADRSVEEGTGIYQVLPPPMAAGRGLDVEEFIFSLVKQSAKGAIRAKLYQKSLRLDEQPRKFGRPRHGASRGPKMMSTAQRRQQQHLYELPEERADFAASISLHSVWEQYMDECWSTLGEPDAPTPSLSDPIDLTGALPTVVEARCPSHVGLCGLVVRESAETIQLLTVKNKLKRVPKKHTVICFTHRQKQLTLPLVLLPAPSTS